MKYSNDKYKKGCVLMKSAIKKYEEGDFEGGDKDREAANGFFGQKAGKQITFDEGDDTSLYGEGRNFGVIYDVFQENVKRLMKEGDGTGAIKEIAREIKANKVLKEEFACYDALNGKAIKGDASKYLEEAVSLMPKFDRNEVAENNEKLIRLFRKHGLDECVEIPEERLKVHEAIEYVMLNQKRLGNIDEYDSSLETIRENLEASKKGAVTESAGKEDYDSQLRSVITRHMAELNEDEEALLKELNENGKRETFEKYKDETLKFISEQIDKCEDAGDKVDWNNVMTKVSIKRFNEEKVLEDIASFINVQDIINE